MTSRLLARRTSGRPRRPDRAHRCRPAGARDRVGHGGGARSLRHPMALAGQALTARAAIGHRVTLGIGLSHRGDDGAARPPLRKAHPPRVSGSSSPFSSRSSTRGRCSSRDRPFLARQTPFSAPMAISAPSWPPSVRRHSAMSADWPTATLAWVGPKTIANHIVPTLAESASEAGRPAPRVVATLPVCVTPQPDAVRARISETLSMYARLPVLRRHVRARRRHSTR